MMGGAKVGRRSGTCRPIQLGPGAGFLHKANISGGGPYGIELPFLGADPDFVNEAHELPLSTTCVSLSLGRASRGSNGHANRSDVRAFPGR